MKLFFAGADGNDVYTTILRDFNIECKLESYWSLGMKKPPSKDFKWLLLDSGGFSARKNDIEIDAPQFAAYLNENEVEFAFNLDVNNLAISLANQKYLEAHSKTYIIPVYHIEEFFDPENRTLFDDYCEKYPYVSIGGVVGGGYPIEQVVEMLDYCFSVSATKTRVHGLGITRQSWLYAYPWYSVDSTSWLTPARFGRFMAPIDDRLQHFYAKEHSYKVNLYREIPYWLKLQSDVTRVWKERGVEWTDFNGREL